MKSDFVSAASHELRTPLTSVRGYADLLRRLLPSDDATVMEALDAIDRQSDRLLRLIRNLLATAHLENEPESSLVETFPFADLVREVRADFHTAGERIRVEIPVDMPVIEADRGRLYEVVANLLDNALKYSPEGHPIELGARVDGGSLGFWVRDHGVGIDLADRGRIFDRFYQADRSAKRRFGGVGLGLHLVKGLLEAMGGSIAVESLPGEGSTFTVWLPLRAVVPETPTLMRTATSV